jgi:hypothetical protein
MTCLAPLNVPTSQGRASATDSQVSERGNAIVRSHVTWIATPVRGGDVQMDTARSMPHAHRLNDHITSSLDLDAALDAIELIGLALVVMPVPPDADRAEIRLEALQLAEHLLERSHSRPPWRQRS